MVGVWQLAVKTEENVVTKKLCQDNFSLSLSRPRMDTGLVDRLHHLQNTLCPSGNGVLITAVRQNHGWAAPYLPQCPVTDFM